MRSWYDSLIGLGREATALQFLEDYGPHAGVLGNLDGKVIDVGGGVGVAARFLPQSSTLVVVDPLPLWSSPVWRDFSHAFRGSSAEPTIYPIDAKSLPFADAEFDAAISFWALNHMSDPRRCLHEMSRVIKPGGLAYLVIDDVEPSWRDILADGVPRIRARIFGTPYRPGINQPLRAAITAKLSGRWTIQPDHLPISERDLVTWTGALKLKRRQRVAGSLALLFVKPP